jgi:hypothetical protein
MAEYKGIKGFKVQYLSADPSDPNIGQTWYNDTSKDLKYTEFAAASWATGGNMGTARYALRKSRNSNSCFSFWRYLGPPTLYNATEEYDGSSWSGGGNLAAARYSLGRSRNTNSRFSIWW